MAFAAHHNRFAFVFFIANQPMDWQLIHEAAKSPEAAIAKVGDLLRYYQPDIVLTEELSGSARKGRTAQRLLLAIKDAVLESESEHYEVARSQPFANKYEYIDWLCERYPQLKTVQPKRRRVFDPEPPHVSTFEAVSLGQQFLG